MDLRGEHPEGPKAPGSRVLPPWIGRARHYDKCTHRVLEGVTLRLGPGEIVAVTGGNGAGKSTLLRCLAGLLRFEGRARVGGLELDVRPNVRRLIGYVPQAVQLPEHASVAEVLDFFPRLRGVVPLLLGAASLAGARERGVLAMVAAQPIPRSSIALGTFLGLAGSLWITVALGFGLASLVLAGVARARDLLPLGALIGTTLAVGTAGLGIGVAISALARGRAQATAVAVAVWLALALGMDLALAGLAPAVRLGPEGLLAAVLVNPLEAARILALLAASSGGTALGPFGAFLRDRFGAPGAVVLLVGAIGAWTALPLALAGRALGRRVV